MGMTLHDEIQYWKYSSQVTCIWILYMMRIVRYCANVLMRVFQSFSRDQNVPKSPDMTRPQWNNTVARGMAEANPCDRQAWNWSLQIIFSKVVELLMVPDTFWLTWNNLNGLGDLASYHSISRPTNAQNELSYQLSDNTVPLKSSRPVAKCDPESLWATHCGTPL